MLDDHRIELAVTYATPQGTLAFDDFAITNTLTERVTIAPVVAVGLQSVRQNRLLTQGGISVATSYYWPRDTGQTGAGYTAPLIAWAGTTITGLISRPIVLSGEFSQTYRPGHHNISEDYVFDPWLEPGIAPDLLAELARAGLRAIIVRRGQPATLVEPARVANDPGARPGATAGPAEEAIILYWGLDGTIRRVR